MTSIAVLSLHTSPLVQPGTGDSGGMNVYVRELVGSLARAGVDSEVFVRRWSDHLPERVEVEPGFTVVHVPAGPAELSKEELPGSIAEFAEGVHRHLAGRVDVAALHANYWLSGVAAHRLKHELCLPLVSTFHTLARVKAVTGDPEPARRAEAEAEIIGCSDVLLASCSAEAEQLTSLYGAPAHRIEIVSPGVDHAFFSPGDKLGARAALGLGEEPMVLFAGRIQPLKRLGLAVEAIAASRCDDAVLVVVGGPSGPDGDAELDDVRRRIEAHGLSDRVRFVPPQPHHLLSSWYRAADVVMVPSRSESFGLVALEAAACGVPVIAAAVGGLTTIVAHAETGFLVDGDDPAPYAERLDDLLTDPALAGAMGAEAARRARSFSWPSTAGRLRRVYADVASRTPVLC